MGGEIECYDIRKMQSAPEPNKLHKLLLGGRHYTADKKQIIHMSDGGPAVNIVVSGYIKRYLILSDGNMGVQIVYGPGDVFSLTQVYKTLFNQSLYSGPEVFYYETLGPAKLSRIDSSELLDAAKRDPMIYADLMQEAGRHLENCVQRLENIELRASSKRLAHQLAFFARHFGSPVTSGIAINVPLTHQDLADILSLTRETVSTNMSDLKKSGLIKSGRYICVQDMKGLERLAYG